MYKVTGYGRGEEKASKTRKNTKNNVTGHGAFVLGAAGRAEKMDTRLEGARDVGSEQPCLALFVLCRRVVAHRKERVKMGAAAPGRQQAVHSNFLLPWPWRALS